LVALLRDIPGDLQSAHDLLCQQDQLGLRCERHRHEQMADRRGKPDPHMLGLDGGDVEHAWNQRSLELEIVIERTVRGFFRIGRCGCRVNPFEKSAVVRAGRPVCKQRHQSFGIERRPVSDVRRRHPGRCQGSKKRCRHDAARDPEVGDPFDGLHDLLPAGGCTMHRRQSVVPGGPHWASLSDLIQAQLRDEPLERRGRLVRGLEG
jgi:hypothetical protein